MTDKIRQLPQAIPEGSYDRTGREIPNTTDSAKKAAQEAIVWVMGDQQKPGEPIDGSLEQWELFEEVQRLVNS